VSRFDHIVFVCTKERDRDDAKGSCYHRGGPQLLDRMKELTKEHKLKGRVRVTSSGCLDYCAKGCTVAVFSADEPAPETWYTHLTPDDAERLFKKHILEGERLEDKVERSAEDRS
jgi:(2Fe-2S) ferredoxin